MGKNLNKLLVILLQRLPYSYLDLSLLILKNMLKFKNTFLELGIETNHHILHQQRHIELEQIAIF